MVLTDDNFATIVTAVEAGRRVYDNVRKFMVYVFAHATPEIGPYLVFALARGLVPLPLTVLQLLCFDVGTDANGGYWYHQRQQPPHPAVRDERFQDQLAGALARLTGVGLP